MGEAIDHIERRIQEQTRERPGRRCGRYVAVTGMHGVGEAQKNPAFLYALDHADLVAARRHAPDLARTMARFALRERVCGADLLETFCRHTGPLYRPLLLWRRSRRGPILAAELSQRTGITVAGTYTPPFRKLDEREERDLARIVDRSAPDILWVGLGTPKQERWMLDHHAALRIPVMVGVGAAFDMLCGRARRAPSWMQRCGLEWFFRLCSEPRRLWKRYLITIPIAMWRLSWMNSISRQLQ